MKKIALCFLSTILLISFSAGTAPAIDYSLHLAVGMGYKESMSADLYVKQTYEPWLESESWALRPSTGIGVTYWNDVNRSGYFWLKDGKLGKGKEHVWGVFGFVGFELIYKLDGWQPYIAYNVGPSYISETEFAGRSLGGRFIFNNRVSAGLRFGKNLQHELSLQYIHYSNAGIYPQNSGYNTFCLMYGYHFN